MFTWHPKFLNVSLDFDQGQSTPPENKNYQSDQQDEQVKLLNEPTKVEEARLEPGSEYQGPFMTGCFTLQGFTRFLYFSQNLKQNIHYMHRILCN